jgi:transposase
MAPTSTVLGIAIATPVLHRGGMDDRGRIVRRKRLARRAWLTLMAPGPPVRLGREAWGSAHDWARQCRDPGPDVRRSAPQVVQAEGPSPKPEGREAAAICEAVTRPTMRLVPLTRLAPQALQALPRRRARLMPARPAWGHASRGLLSEDGRVLPHSLAQLRAVLVEQLEAKPATLTALSTAVCWPLDEAWLALEQRLESDAAKLAARGQAPPACPRRQTPPGSGPVTATALIAALGAVTPVQNGRHRAAGLGVVPREHATGGQLRRLGIRTRGARSRRHLLVHGARATLRWVDPTCADRSPGLRARLARRGQHRAAVALAHKPARLVWARLAHHHAYGVRTVRETG